jgi:RNA polymerase sigma factor (TIGR02999 family)
MRTNELVASKPHWFSQSLPAWLGGLAPQLEKNRDFLVSGWYTHLAPLVVERPRPWVPPVSEITHILSAIEQGDPQAASQLLPLVYEELRRLAAQKLGQEKPGQTLSATALVHEAYLRLVDVQRAQQWNSRGHFFAAAAEAMRRILINRARDKMRHKRGGGWKRIDLDHVTVADQADDEELLALDDCLERLAQEDPACAELVKLRFFAGLSQEEAATALGLPRRTADRSWAYARAWLCEALSQADPPETPSP